VIEKNVQQIIPEPLKTLGKDLAFVQQLVFPTELQKL
jgi:hypothetical protein